MGHIELRYVLYRIITFMAKIFSFTMSQKYHQNWFDGWRSGIAYRIQRESWFWYVNWKGDRS